ncbi:MAG: tetratricopeptide repeat protein [Verrucomicrobiota bacterium]
MKQLGNKSKLALISLLLGALTVAVYWPVVHHDFITLDDSEYVTENEWVTKGLSWEGVKWAFTTGHASNWHPLTWLTHQLDCQLFGLNPTGPHAINLALHLANSILLLLLLHQMTGTIWRSAMVAMLFALHPLHVESVAWIAERKDVLSAFFGILTLMAYTRYVNDSKIQSPRSKVWYAVALGLFACGLMSKPMLVTWPFVLLLLDLWPLLRVQPEAGRWDLGYGRGRILTEKIPFFAMTIASCVITFLVQRQGGAVSTSGNLPMEDRLANAVVSYVKYLRKTIWPDDLAIFYPHPELRFPASEQWPTMGILAAAVFLVVISVSVFKRVAKQPYLAVGWFIFIGTLVPTIGVVQVGTQALADRYTYIPLIGIFIIITWGVADLLQGRRSGRVVAGGLGGGLTLGCLIITSCQVKTWKDDFSICRHALNVTKYNPVAHSLLGKALARNGQQDEAITQFRAALEAYPYFRDAHQDLGAMLLAKSNITAAISEFEAQLTVRPNYVPSYIALGVCYELLSQHEKAQEYYAQTLQVAPDHALANYAIGLAAAERGQFQTAANHFRLTLAQDPNHPQALISLAKVWLILNEHGENVKLLQPKTTSASPADQNAILGNALAALGQQAAASQCFTNAIRMEPGLPERYTREGKTFFAKGQMDVASAWFYLVARLEPNSAEANEQLGTLLAAVGKLSEATSYFEKALSIKPSAKVYYNLALVKALTSDDQATLSNLEHSIQLEPDRAETLNELAWMLATHPKPEFRDGRRAVALAERVCENTKELETRYWGTLDAAYAEAGRYADAIRIAEKTVALARAKAEPHLAEAAEKRLTCYREHRPFHQ